MEHAAQLWPSRGTCIHDIVFSPCTSLRKVLVVSALCRSRDVDQYRWMRFAGGCLVFLHALQTGAVKFILWHHRMHVTKSKPTSPFMATDWRWCWTPKRLKVHLPTFTTGFVLPSIKNCVLSASSSVVWRIVVPAIEWSFRIGCGLYQQ